ncbi:unnamed protein product [Laminaria digitata]
MGGGGDQDFRGVRKKKRFINVERTGVRIRLVVQRRKIKGGTRRQHLILCPCVWSRRCNVVCLGSLAFTAGQSRGTREAIGVEAWIFFFLVPGQHLKLESIANNLY